MKKSSLILVLPVLFINLLNSAAHAALDPQASDNLKGQPVRNFQASTLDGKKFSFSDVRGKPLMINFFTSWCPVCTYQSEDLVKLTPELSAKGIQIYGILADAVESPDTVAEAITTLSKQPLPYPVLLMTESMKTIFSYEGFPATYFIDKDGNFSTTLFGHVPIEQVRFASSQIATSVAAKNSPISSTAPILASDVHHWPWEKSAIQAFFPTQWKAWHPLFVHFPIALLILEALLIGLLLKRTDENLILFSKWIWA